MTSQPPDYEGPVIRDKRRFDPQTGALREPQVAAATAAPGPADEASNPTVANGAGSPPAADQPEEISVQLAERTADLQRLQAEYVNYKRRVDRDREVARDAAKVSVLTALLPVLDDIGRAREHEELTGGFKAVAESLERTVTTQGLTAFGEVGDAFDPHRHEALMHHYSNEVAGPVCQAIVQVGYQFGERVVRPARVAVAEPADSIDIAPADGSNLVPTDASSAEPVEAIKAESGTDGVGDDVSPEAGSHSDRLGEERSMPATDDVLTDREAVSAGGADSAGDEPGTESTGAAGRGAATS